MASPSKSQTRGRRAAGLDEAARGDQDQPWLGLFDRLRRFGSDERGVAMTELIITLPVFIIIFAAVANLHKINRNGLRTKIMASKDMWTQAMDVQKGAKEEPFELPPLEQSFPQLAGLDALDKVQQYPSEHGDWPERYKDFGLITDASEGEADGAVTGLSLIGHEAPDDYPGSDASDFAEAILSDQDINSLSMPSGLLNVYILATISSYWGPNQGPAAGMRYGMVAGHHKEEFSVFQVNYTMETSYDVLNSPVAKPRGADSAIAALFEGGLPMATYPGFSRLMAAEDDCLGNVLELSTDMGYMSNCM